MAGKQHACDKYFAYADRPIHACWHVSWRSTATGAGMILSKCITDPAFHAKARQIRQIYCSKRVILSENIFWFPSRGAHVQVRVVEGRGLAKMDVMGLSDPYCVLTLGQKVWDILLIVTLYV
jgi:hypothetical protein